MEAIFNCPERSKFSCPQLPAFKTYFHCNWCLLCVLYSLWGLFHSLTNCVLVLVRSCCFLFKRGESWNRVLKSGIGWSWICSNPPASASPSAEVMCVCHHAWLLQLVHLLWMSRRHCTSICWIMKWLCQKREQMTWANPGPLLWITTIGGEAVLLNYKGKSIHINTHTHTHTG